MSEATIRYRKWTCRKLSQSVGIIKQPNRNRLGEMLSTIEMGDTGLTRSQYKISCAEKFIVDFPSISAKIYKVAKNTDEIRIYKESLFTLVRSVNPSLDPRNVFISDSNTLTVFKTNFPLVECHSWAAKEEPLEQIFDPDIILDASNRSDLCSYRLHSERWKTAGMTLQVKQFKKTDKVDLVIGFEPKNNEQKKLYFVALCIDNLFSVRNYLSQNKETADLSPKQIIDDFYKIALKHNPWIKMNLSEFKKINKEWTGQVTEARQGASTVASESKGYKSLKAVPKKKIVQLEQHLKENVFGQDEAIEAVCRRVRKAYAGLKLDKYPIGAFFFFGSTSVGKTELPRQLADYLMGSPSHLIKIDCNTLQQDHEVTFLLGAPPSYVGYEDGGILSSQLEDNQFKVILFDEVEKATPKLFDFVLSFIDEGKAFDKRGNLLDFSDCIFVFTSNLGQKEANDAIMSKMGFRSLDSGDDSQALKREFNKIIKKKLKPEFLARIKAHGGIFYFDPLSREDLIMVADKYLDEVSEAIDQNSNIALVVDDEVLNFIVDRELQKNPRAHARDIITAVESEVVERITDEIITTGFLEKKAKNKHVMAILVGDEIHFECVEGDHGGMDDFFTLLVLDDLISEGGEENV